MRSRTRPFEQRQLYAAASRPAARVPAGRAAARAVRGIPFLKGGMPSPLPDAIYFKNVRTSMLEGMCAVAGLSSSNSAAPGRIASTSTCSLFAPLQEPIPGSLQILHPCQSQPRYQARRAAVPSGRAAASSLSGVAVAARYERMALMTAEWGLTGTTGAPG